MPFDWWTLALQTVNVLILVWILARFFFRPIAGIVAKRREETERLLADAEAKRRQAEEQRAAADAARAQVADERESLMADAQKAAEAEKARLLDEFAEALARQRQEADSGLARQKAEVEGELIARASDLSVEIAQRLLRRLPPETVFTAFLAGLETVLRNLPADGAASLAGTDGEHPVEVVTAAPLDGGQAAQVRALLQSVGGADVQIAFRTDPGLIAGIEVHARNTIIRNNWQADLTRIREELTHDRNHLRLERWAAEAKGRVDAIDLAPAVEEVGRVESAADGIALVSGLPDLRLDELVVFEHGEAGFAMTLDRDRVGCVLLDVPEGLEAGHKVRGTGEVVRVPVGPGFLGRTVDPLGRPLDGGGEIEAADFLPIDRPAPGIIERDFVTEPVQTGLLVLDSMFALGRGQRELIVGDRAIGKTAVAVDCIINQKSSDMICVYVAVGQKSSTVRRVIDAVHAHGAPDRCIFVIASASAPPGLQWIAPFAGFTLAEYFRDRGQHALIVIDDMSKHAATHREIALLTRQPPGREAYPGDVFYVHARLLERAAKLSATAGGGSLTALPIAELDAGNLSAYIPTNLISITDGQIVLDSRLFHEGHKPAVDTGTSVSRIGGKTQAPALREAAHAMRLDYAQFLELEMFTRFGGVTDEQVKEKMVRGRRIRAILSQLQYAPLRLVDEIGLVMAVQSGLLDPLPLDRIAQFRAEMAAFLDREAPAAAQQIAETGKLDEGGQAELQAALQRLADRIAREAGGVLMAQRLAGVEAQIQNVRQLGTVVTAMRGIAAARAQQGRSMLGGIDAYSDVISDAIGHALALLPGNAMPPTAATAGGRAVILFGAEQGFAGTFAERLLEAVGGSVPGADLFLIGSRTIALAAERRVTPDWSVAMTTHIDAIPSMVNHLTQALYDRIADGSIADVDLIYARSAGSGVEVERHSLLPLDYALFTRAAAAFPPITLLAPHVLLERLAEEYVFAQLYKAAMHAFEAENTARMIAMAAAKGNIEAKLDRLAQWQRQLRQDEITEEITELAAGAEALRGR